MRAMWTSRFDGRKRRAPVRMSRRAPPRSWTRSAGRSPAGADCYVDRVATRELILSFEGPDKLVRPDRCDVRPLLEVLLSFVQLLEKIGAYNAALDSDDAPFAVVMKELRAGSIKNVLDFVPRRTAENVAAVHRAGLEAARVAPNYLERRDVGPRTRAKRLAAALGKLPPR